MNLRPYQTDLIERVRDSYRKGKKAPCIVLPCGGGKSVIVADIAKNATLKGNRVLFIVHRKELCQQIESTFKWWGVDMSLCSVMMVQTAARRIKKLETPQLIITDENHHSKAATYRKLYDAFPDAKRVGVTATPVRLDGSGLSDVNDDLVIGVSAKWLIENKFLAPYDYYAPKLVDMTGIKIKRGEYDVTQVENLMIQKAVYGDVIKNYQKLANNRQAICYCTTVKHSLMMAYRFAEAGIKAAHIDGETSAYERQRIIDGFRAGEIKVLCNVDLISEGFDVPDCSCVIMLRPTQSLVLYTQQSMRCMRYQPYKKAVIIDHVGNYTRFGMPDADRAWKLDAVKGDKVSGVEALNITQCPMCFYTYEGDSRACPACGYFNAAPKEERKEIETEEDTELQKIDGFVVDYQTADECKTLEELKAFAKKRGYKSGWVYYQQKQRGWLH